MRINDWSSDVCSSDLDMTFGKAVHAELADDLRRQPGADRAVRVADGVGELHLLAALEHGLRVADHVGVEAVRHFVAEGVEREDRKSVVLGKSGSVRVDLGGRRILKKKKNKTNKTDCK